jgi:hypothetical protein
MSPFRVNDLTTRQWLAILGLALVLAWLAFGGGVERMLHWLGQVLDGVRVR